MWSKEKLRRSVTILGLLYILLLDPATVTSAPVTVEEGEYEEGGCYYMLDLYKNGEQIRTNEPCLNCTCANSLLMCYLKTCPFSKPIGSECAVERVAGQCCPIIKCPEVPVMIPDTPPFVAIGKPQSSTVTSSPTTAIAAIEPSEGCYVGEDFFLEGSQVPQTGDDPCDLCYCIHNHTACVKQRCILEIPGCVPKFKDGVCCPIGYDCDSSVLFDLEPTTTTTTVLPSTGCFVDDDFYYDGSIIDTGRPCDHCYCMQGKLVCAVQECEPPAMESCVPIYDNNGCCPSKFECPHTEHPEVSTTEVTSTSIWDAEDRTDPVEILTNATASPPPPPPPPLPSIQDDVHTPSSSPEEEGGQSDIQATTSLSDDTGDVAISTSPSDPALLDLVSSTIPEEVEDSATTKAPERHPVTSSESSGRPEGISESTEWPDGTTAASSLLSSSPPLDAVTVIGSEDASSPLPLSSTNVPLKDDMTTEKTPSEDDHSSEAPPASEWPPSLSGQDSVFPQATTESSTLAFDGTIEGKFSPEIVETTSEASLDLAATDAPAASKWSTVDLWEPSVTTADLSISASTSTSGLVDDESPSPVTPDDIRNASLWQEDDEKEVATTVDSFDDKPIWTTTTTAASTAILSAESTPAIVIEPVPSGSLDRASTVGSDLVAETEQQAAEVTDVPNDGVSTAPTDEALADSAVAITTEEVPESSSVPPESGRPSSPSGHEQDDGSSSVPSVVDVALDTSSQRPQEEAEKATTSGPALPEGQDEASTPDSLLGDEPPKREGVEDHKEDTEAVSTLLPPKGPDDKDPTDTGVLGIPGEGDCYQDGITYRNDAAVRSKDVCAENCTCKGSIIVCQKVICLQPENYAKDLVCHELFEDGRCCPILICNPANESHVMEAGSLVSEVPTTTEAEEGAARPNGTEKVPQDALSSSSSIKPLDVSEVQEEEATDEPLLETTTPKEAPSDAQTIASAEDDVPTTTTISSDGIRTDDIEKQTLSPSPTVGDVVEPSTSLPHFIDDVRVTEVAASSSEEVIIATSTSISVIASGESLDVEDVKTEEAPSTAGLIEATTTPPGDALDAISKEPEIRDATPLDDRPEPSTSTEKHIIDSEDDATRPPPPTSLAIELDVHVAATTTSEASAGWTRAPEVGTTALTTINQTSEVVVTRLPPSTEPSSTSIGAFDVTESSEKQPIVSSWAPVTPEVEDKLETVAADIDPWTTTTTTRRPEDDEEALKTSTAQSSTPKLNDLTVENASTSNPDQGVPDGQAPASGSTPVPPPRKEIPDDLVHEVSYATEDITVQPSPTSVSPTRGGGDVEPEVLSLQTHLPPRDSSTESSVTAPVEESDSPASLSTEEAPISSSRLPEVERPSTTVKEVQQEWVTSSPPSSSPEVTAAISTITPVFLDEEGQKTTAHPAAVEIVHPGSTSPLPATDVSTDHEDIATSSRSPDPLSVTMSKRPIWSTSAEPEAPTTAADVLPDESVMISSSTEFSVPSTKPQESATPATEKAVDGLLDLAGIKSTTPESLGDGQLPVVQTSALPQEESIIVSTSTMHQSVDVLQEGTSEGILKDEATSKATTPLASLLDIATTATDTIKWYPSTLPSEIAATSGEPVTAAFSEIWTTPAKATSSSVKPLDLIPEAAGIDTTQDDLLRATELPEGPLETTASSVPVAIITVATLDPLLKSTPLSPEVVNATHPTVPSPQAPSLTPMTTPATASPTTIPEVETKPVTTTSSPDSTEDPFGGHPDGHFPDVGIPITSDNFTLEEGDCVYDGRIYASALQIPREDPCDFCFCFRGDIICLQQSCPPPIDGCFEESIPGFCCPRYECPVTAVTLNVTDTKVPYPVSATRFRTVRALTQLQVVVCEFGSKFYNKGEFIAPASGPCMDCVCGERGTMKCIPKKCQLDPIWQSLPGFKKMSKINGDTRSTRNRF